MKYSININQLVLAETSLDIVDAAILDFLTFICNSRNEKVEAERIRDERGSWTWVDYGHLLRDMPLLKITDKSAISQRIQKIEQEEYITTRRVGNQGLYVLLTAKVDELLIKNNSSDDLKQQSRSFKTTDNDTRDNTTKIKSASPSGDALRSRSVQEYFTEAYTRKFGRQPAINFGKDLAVVKKTLPLFKSLDELKSLIDAFLDSEYAARVGYSLSICFAAHTINLWQAGQLTAPIQTKFTTTKI